MTSIAVRKNLHPFTVEDRSWLAGPAGTGPGQTPTVTLKVSAFPVGNGYVPSGTAISKGSDGKWVPFDASKTEHALLFGALRNDRGDIAGAGLIAGFVHAAKLPGGLPANLAALRTALPLIHFYA